MCQSCVFNAGFHQSLPKLKLSLYCTFDLSLSLFMFLVACFPPSQCLHFAPLTLHSIQFRKRDLLCFCHWNCMPCEQWPAASSKALRAWPRDHSCWGGLCWESSPGLVRVSVGRQELAVGQGGLTSAVGLAWVQIWARHHEPASLASSLSLGKKRLYLTHPRARAVVSP